MTSNYAFDSKIFYQVFHNLIPLKLFGHCKFLKKCQCFPQTRYQCVVPPFREFSPRSDSRPGGGEPLERACVGPTAATIRTIVAAVGPTHAPEVHMTTLRSVFFLSTTQSICGAWFYSVPQVHTMVYVWETMNVAPILDKGKQKRSLPGAQTCCTS